MPEAGRARAGGPGARGLWLVVLAVASIAYPVVVLVLRGRIPANGFVVLALALIMLRLATLDSDTARAWRPALALAAGMLVLAAAIDGELAARAYPAVLSAGASLAFAATLRHPPSLIERIARLRERDLPEAASAYCRGVTILWAAWLAANAAVAGGLALFGSIELWALWTGLIAYLVSAALFAGEYLVRIRRRRQAAPR